MYAANLNYQTNTHLNLVAKNSLLKIVKGLKPTPEAKVLPLNNKLRILSIDGGGIRAILPAIILAELEEHLKRESGNLEASIVDYFDLFAGTSAGAILATLYLTPSEDDPRKPKFTAKEVLELYLQDGCKTFLPANPDKSKARSEKYCASILEEKLKQLLGEDTCMDQLLKPTFITAFNTETESPVYFESWKMGSCKTWQVARASSAAPGMFKAAIVDEYHNEQALIDGSIFAGNPAMCAYTLANSTRFSDLPNCLSNIDFPTIDDMTLLSLGTGKVGPATEIQKSSWIRSMMKNLMSSGIALVDYQLKQLFSSQTDSAYFRLNPALTVIENAIDNAGTENLNTLYETGKNFLKENEKTIDKLIQSVL